MILSDSSSPERKFPKSLLSIFYRLNEQPICVKNKELYVIVLSENLESDKFEDPILGLYHSKRGHFNGRPNLNNFVTTNFIRISYAPIQKTTLLRNLQIKKGSVLIFQGD